MDKLSVSFTRKEEDMLHYYGIVAGGRQLLSCVLLIINSVLSGYAALRAVEHIFGKNFINTTDLSVIALWAGFFILCYLFLNQLIYLFANNNITDSRGNFVSPKNVIIDAEGITETSDGQNSCSSWHTVLDITRTGGYILVMIDKMQAYLIPERAFATTADADAFHDRALSYWRDATGAST